jgi:hypothetical protein
MKRSETVAPTTAPIVARHLALLAFACFIALAAWPPPRGIYGYVGGRHVAISLEARRLLAEVTENTVGTAGRTSPSRATRYGATPAVLRFLPAGVVLEHASGSAAFVRLGVPMPAAVGATGVLWHATVAAAFPRKRPDRETPDRVGPQREAAAHSTGGAIRLRKLREIRTWVWGFRYAAGSMAVAAVWYCVYTFPAGTVYTPLTEAQALHVAGASFGVCVAMMLITFD